jgi:hypothetical protein
VTEELRTAAVLVPVFRDRETLDDLLRFEAANQG